MAKEKTKVLILGGGFGGVKAARCLSGDPDVTVTILTNHKTFRYGATLWRTATGHRKKESYIPVEELTKGLPNTKLILDEADKIDKTKKQVKTKSGHIFEYDYCIISLGVITSYFGIKGLEEYSYTIKSDEGLSKLRQHLHDELLDEGVLDKNYVVVGAGPTGVELSAALKSYMASVARYHGLKRSKVNLQLIEAAPRVLPALLPAASLAATKRLRRLGVHTMTNSHVQGETATMLIVDKRRIPTKTVIWTAGVTNNPFFAANPEAFELNERKKVVVDDKLKVDPSIFVIGDNAATPFSGLALTAIHNAKFVANTIIREIRGKSTHAYKPQPPLTVIPVGEGWSVLQWRKFVLSGFTASIIRVLVDLLGYGYVMGWKRAAQLWLGRNEMEEDCPECKPKTA